jgi:hypothetical protein
MLRGVFHPLQAKGWAADSRSMVFTQAPAPAPRVGDAHAPFLLDMKIPKGRLHDVYMLPLRWSDEPVPAWFLDAISHLLHVKTDTVHGLELVSPLRHALREEMGPVIQEHGGEKSSGEYIDFLRKLTGLQKGGRPILPD